MKTAVLVLIVSAAAAMALALPVLAQPAVPALWNEDAFQGVCNQRWRVLWTYLDANWTDEEKAAFCTYAFPEPSAIDRAEALERARHALLKLGVGGDETMTALGKWQTAVDAEIPVEAAEIE